MLVSLQKETRWWFQICFFTTLWGKITILTNIFQMGWFNHQLDMLFIGPLTTISGFIPSYTHLQPWFFTGFAGVISLPEITRVPGPFLWWLVSNMFYSNMYKK